MTKHTELDPEAMRRRIRSFCEWKQIPFPAWAHNPPEASIDGIAAFCAEHYVSMDWFLVGDGPDPSSEQGQFVSLMRQLPDDVVDRMLAVVQRHTAKPERRPDDLCAALKEEFRDCPTVGRALDECRGG